MEEAKWPDLELFSKLLEYFGSIVVCGLLVAAISNRDSELPRRVRSLKTENREKQEV